METQVAFRTDYALKQKALSKAKKQGLTLKAILTMAMREYLKDNLVLSLRPSNNYFDEVFADKGVVRKANQLGRTLSKI